MQEAKTQLMPVLCAPSGVINDYSGAVPTAPERKVIMVLAPISIIHLWWAGLIGGILILLIAVATTKLVPFPKPQFPDMIAIPDCTNPQEQECSEQQLLLRR